jgi:hypothetical protein
MEAGNPNTLEEALDEFLARAVDSERAVLVRGVDEATLRQAVVVAGERGTSEVTILALRDSFPEGGPLSGSLRERLHVTGLVLLRVERLLFGEADGAAATRVERIEAETKAALLRCLVESAGDTPRRLEEEIVRLSRQTELLAQLDVDHARTRDVERERSERLARLQKLVDEKEVERLVAEVERLNGELEALQSTRIWRLGQAYWRFRGRTAPTEPR